MSSDENHSTIQPAIVNFSARFEREIEEINVGLTGIRPDNKEKILAIIQEKLDFIYRGLDVILDQKKNVLLRAEKAEIQLLQRHVLNLQLNLRSKTISELVALLERLKEQMRLVNLD